MSYATSTTITELRRLVGQATDLAQVRDTDGGETLLCGGHADDARQRLIGGVTMTPIAAGRQR